MVPAPLTFLVHKGSRMPNDERIRFDFQKLVEENRFHTPDSVSGALNRKHQLHRLMARANEELDQANSSHFQSHAHYESWCAKVKRRIQFNKYEIGFLNRYIDVQEAEAVHGKGAFDFFSPKPGESVGKDGG